MNTHNDHYLVICDPHGKQIHRQVVYFQPFDAHSQSQSAVVHIVASDWLPSYGHDAIYTTSAQSISGHFTPHGYSAADRQRGG